MSACTPDSLYTRCACAASEKYPEASRSHAYCRFLAQTYDYLSLENLEDHLCPTLGALRLSVSSRRSFRGCGIRVLLFSALSVAAGKREKSGVRAYERRGTNMKAGGMCGRVHECGWI